MHEGWKYRKLNDLGRVARGKSKHRPRNDPALYGGAYPFIQTGDVKAANLFISEYTQTYNEHGLAQSKLWEPGTLCITIAANISESAILKRRACFPDSIVGFLADPQESDVRFVKYLLDTMKLRIQGISRGTTQDNLSLEKLFSVQFLVPPLPTQRRIASILSAYDDLIENNLRRIKILEEMAQLIYREWFVNFRFPGHEKIKFVNSKLGKIPEGWHVRSLGECLDHQIGGGWGKEIESSKYSEAAYVIRGTDIPSARVGEIDKSPLRFHTVSNLKIRRLRAGDIVFEVSGGSKDQPLGRVLLTTSHLLARFDQAVMCASFCKLIRTDDELPPGLLYLRLLEAYENRELMKYQVQSTGIANFKFTHFLNDFLTLVPSDIVREVFARLTDPLFELLAVLGARNANLRQTRDLLLPRLVSGEVDVEDLDISIPEEEEVPIAQAV